MNLRSCIATCLFFATVPTSRAFDLMSMLGGMGGLFGGMPSDMTPEETMAYFQRMQKRQANFNDESKRYMKQNREAEGVVELGSGVQYKVVKKGDGWFKPDHSSSIQFAYATFKMQQWSERQMLIQGRREKEAWRQRFARRQKQFAAQLAAPPAAQPEDDKDEDGNVIPKKEKTEEQVEQEKRANWERGRVEQQEQREARRLSRTPDINETMINDWIWLEQHVGMAVPAIKSGLGAPVTDTIRNCLKGIKEVLPMMVEGDIWEITMPPQLAFGTEGLVDEDAGKFLIPQGEAVVTRLELLTIFTERTSVSKCGIDMDGSYAGCTKKEGNYIDKFITQGKDACNKEMKRINNILLKNTGDNLDLSKVRWMEQRIWLLEEMIRRLRKGLQDEDEM